MIHGFINQLPFAKNLTEVVFTGISINSRTLNKGNIFFAIVGDNFDGFNFIDEAIKKGAVAIVVEREVATTVSTILVKNVKQSLYDTAKWWRDKSSAKFIAITGSNGKTTTKEMLKTVLSTENNTLATVGNLNNDLGVVLTLCNLAQDDKYAVIEIGANHLGEIKPLASLVRPDIAVVTNIFEAHLGEFGSVENIVKTKAELYQSLTKDDMAIIDINSAYKNTFLKNIKTKNIFYVGQDIKATNITRDNNFDLIYKDELINITLNLLGKHQVQNALVVALIAIKLGLSLQQIKQGLESCKSVKGRLSIEKVGEITFIDDSYNANPTSMKKSLDVLNNYSNDKIAILGDMAELGSSSKKLHKEVIDYAKNIGIKNILSLGDEAKNYQVMHFDNHQELADYLIQTINKPTTVLIKGSRTMQLEKIISLCSTTQQTLNNCDD